MHKLQGFQELAAAKFSDLTIAERMVLRCAQTGAIAYAGAIDLLKDSTKLTAALNDRTNHPCDNPANDPTKAKEWGKQREIRADLIRWMCVDQQARQMVDPKGIQVVGAKICGQLDLSHTSISFAIQLWCCWIPDLILLLGADMSELGLERSRASQIIASSIRVKGAVSLRRGFIGENKVDLTGAKIGGQLDCAGSTFKVGNQGSKRIALVTDGAEIGGDVRLNMGFHAEGMVSLTSTKIGGMLDCHDSIFDSRQSDGDCLSLGADRAEIAGTVFLSDGFRPIGAVRLIGAKIGGDVECRNADFSELSQLLLNGARITGALFQAI